MILINMPLRINSKDIGYDKEIIFCCLKLFVYRNIIHELKALEFHQQPKS